MNIQRWVTLGIGLLLALLAIGLLLPAIQSSREEARRMNSLNNLKQMGEALLSYHKTEKCLPPGGIIGEGETPLRGWMTQILPHTKSSALNKKMKPDEAWNSPGSWPWYQVPISEFRIPGEQINFTVEGYSLTQYLGNPHLLYRNSNVTFDQMENGTAHTWVAGEVAGNYQPWAYTFNWRPLGTKLCEGVNSYGHPPWSGGHLLFADGKVSFFSDQTSDVILKKFAAAPPVPTEEQMAVPDKVFETGDFHWKFFELHTDPQADLVYRVKTLETLEQSPVLAQVFSSPPQVDEKEAAKPAAKQKPRPDPQLLFSIDSGTDIPAAVKESPLADVSTPEQLEANIKLLQSIQKQMQ